jgi:hypothetical protein
MRQWVADVPKYSSQYGNEKRLAFSVDNLRGPTNVFPGYGESVEAFELRTYGRWHEQCPSFVDSLLNRPWAAKNCRLAGNVQPSDFVDLRFEVPVVPAGIEVYETYNPGCVAGVYVFDKGSSSWAALWTRNGREGAEDQEAAECRRNRAARLFSPPLRRVDFDTEYVFFFTLPT